MTERQQKRRWRPIDVVMALISAIVVALFVLSGAFIYFEKSGRQAALTQANAKLAGLKNRGAPVAPASLKAIYVSKTVPDDTAEWIKVFNHFAPKHFQEYIEGTSPYDQPPPTINEAPKKNPLALQLLQSYHLRFPIATIAATSVADPTQTL